MPLFRKNHTASKEAELTEIEVSMRLVRLRLGTKKMPLGDLFAMIGETASPVQPPTMPAMEPEPERVLPRQVALSPDGSLAHFGGGQLNATLP